MNELIEEVLIFLSSYHGPSPMLGLMLISRQRVVEKHQGNNPEGLFSTCCGKASGSKAGFYLIQEELFSRQ